MKKLGQESAFPIRETKDTESIELGMSKRFYAACAAMQGLLANPSPDMIRSNPTQIADMAYEFADELLRKEEAE